MFQQTINRTDRIDVWLANEIIFSATGAAKRFCRGLFDFSRLGQNLWPFDINLFSQLAGFFAAKSSGLLQKKLQILITERISFNLVLRTTK
jgi:hypothetical protein